MRIVEKVWGREEILVEEPQYTLKRLVIIPGMRSSLHYHPVKKETFVLESGVVHVELDLPKESLVLMESPTVEIVTIEPGRPHRFWTPKGCQKPGTLLEVSTRHSDEDVVRIESSGRAPE
jgi:mannose-6-phosphate isomerase-like protein (cupin superfamily)